MKKSIKVSYTITVEDKEIPRLCKMAHELGCDYNDAGPVLSIQRLLMDSGIDGAFPNEHQVGLEFSLDR